jgi:AAA+ superfamily predicted ATPase
MSLCGTPFINQVPTKESIFRAELTKLALPDRVRRIDYRLAELGFALATRNEKLLALRSDFDALTLDFWRGFGSALGCENPESTVALQKARMRSIGHLGVILLTIAMTVVVAIGARDIPELAVFIAVAGVVALCVIIGAPYRQIARARQVAVVLGQEQEPFWLTSGAIALSNLGITPPPEVKWWWPDRTVLVFVRHIAVRFSVDAFTCEPVWADPVPAANNELSARLASQILRDLLSGHPRYRQMVSTFQGLAGLENELSFLTDLKAETEQALAVELRQAEERAAQLRRQAEDLHSAQPQETQQKSTETSQARPDPGATVPQSEPRAAQKAQVEHLTWNDLIIEDTLRIKLQTYCEILQQAEAFRERGVTIPKGLLFYGPPGTGKTQTARVLAAQSGLAFVGCTTADIKQGWIGHSGQKVKEIFAGARATAPTILFIDELEAITNDLDSSPDTITAELTAQLLQEIDGIQSHPQAVFLIGATNQPDRINRALFNRFTEKIEYPLPSLEQRTKLLDLLIGHRTLTADTSRAALLQYLAGLSDGASGRELRTMVERATIHAISRARGQGRSLDFALTPSDFQPDDGGEAPGEL